MSNDERDRDLLNSLLNDDSDDDSDDETETETETEAEKAWGKVTAAFAHAEYLRDRGGVSTAIKAESKAEAMRAAWRLQYPTEAAAKDDAAAKRRADKESEIRSRPGYRAALEGRD